MNLFLSRLMRQLVCNVSPGDRGFNAMADAADRGAGLVRVSRVGTIRNQRQEEAKCWSRWGNGQQASFLLARRVGGVRESFLVKTQVALSLACAQYDTVPGIPIEYPDPWPCGGNLSRHQFTVDMLVRF